MSSVEKIRQELRALGSPERAQHSLRFFKTGKGEYGEGDVFLGLTMPVLRKAIIPHRQISLDTIVALLQSPEHEFRMAALLIMVHQFTGSKDVNTRHQIYKTYLKNTRWINNWNLVDASAEFIVGPWLEGQQERMNVLGKLAQSGSIWERRIAMLATFCYIKKGLADDALQIATILLHDDEDLIQKAVGWMLREIGKRCSLKEEEAFLQAHYRTMPRTMLRYAIEHFPEKTRKAYLNGTI